MAVVCALAVAVPAAAVDDDRGPTAARMVVGFRAMPEEARAGDYGHGRVVARDDVLGFLVVETPAPDRLRAEAAHDARVRYVEEDTEAVELFAPNDAQWTSAYAYGPKIMGAPAAWDTTLGANAVLACVVDSGVRASHEDLTGRYAGGIDLHRGDAVPDAETGHGTHITGILAASTNNGLGIAGLAQVSFLHAKVTGSGGGSGSGMSSGIRWCADNGAHVISISLGTTSSSTTLSDAVNYAWNKGAVLVAAAGNSGPGADTLLWPAKYPNVIAVGAVNSQKQLASFSSTGPDLDLVAPGYSILSTWYTGDASYGLLSGTSMAAPHVAGAAALLKSARPDLTNAQVKGLLESTAQDLGAVGPDASFGHGLVRADLAISAAIAAPAPDPAPEPTPTPSPACSDGLDNDADDRTDYPTDAGCTDATDSDETDPAPTPAPAPAPAPSPAYGVDVSPASQSGTVRNGRGTTTYTFTVTNTGDSQDQIGLTLGSRPAGWTGTLSATQLDLAPGAAGNVLLTVKASKGMRGETWTATVTATSVASPTLADAGTATTTAT